MVALSGGVWQNAYLYRKSIKLLKDAGFKVLVHTQLPCNDGCISFGQALITREIIN
jgi:hydrogenase maturation protein HypF